MLTRLLPEQISDFWDIIKYAIEESLPPTVDEHPDKMNRILSSALSGGLDIWASYERAEEGVKFEGIIVTKINFDDASGTRSMLMYCLYGYADAAEGTWMEGLTILAKYAKSRKCSRITAYTSIPYMIALADKLGANTKYTFISWDLSKIV